tara:strand:- start:1980 stop:2303 length:324 start_codon:yes stop_codon:yes gene_type:complete
VLSKHHRLSQKEKTPKIRGSVRFSGVFMSSTFVPHRNGDTSTKFLIVAPTRAIKKATQRNLVRRRVRHIIKKLEPKWKKGTYSLYLKKNSERVSFKELEEDVKKIFA